MAAAERLMVNGKECDLESLRGKKNKCTGLIVTVLQSRGYYSVKAGKERASLTMTCFFIYVDRCIFLLGDKSVSPIF